MEISDLWPLNKTMITQKDIEAVRGSLQAVVRAGSREGPLTPQNPQPTYADLWDAFVAGAKEARQNPKADEKQFNLAADGYCKLIHAQKAPEMFEAMSSKSPNPAICDVEKAKE